VTGAVVAVDIPNPLGPIIDGAQGLISGGTHAVGQAALDAILGWFATTLASACTTVATELFRFLNTSATVNLEQGWWAGPRAQHILASVGQLAGVLMIGFLLLVVIQGTLAGEPGVMVRAAVKEVPMAVFGTVALVAIASLLLGLTDAASGMVLADAPDSLSRFLSGFGQSGTILSGGLLAIILFLFFLIGALLVWIELVVRSSLIYLLIAAAPLTLAARVWPAARGAFRRLCEIGLALILSKFVIALALALGAVALAGGGPATGDATQQTALDFAGLLTGATLMLLAAFTPFVLLKILPIAEAAVVAQGISHSPARGANTVAQGAFYARNLSGHRSPPTGGSAPGRPTPPGGGPPPPTPGGAAGGPVASGTAGGGAAAAAVPVGAAVAVGAAAKRAATAPSRTAIANQPGERS